jgi:putative addiction module component (TIGR02574 family)
MEDMMPVIPFDHLTREERLTLIGELIDSLGDEPADLPEEHRAELLRRLSTLEEDEKQSVSWDAFRQELVRRYG